MREISENLGKAIMDLRDPFGKRCIEDISIRICPKGLWGRGNPCCYARIEFKNGPTKGEHMTENFDTLDALIAYLNEFTQNLPD